MGHIYQLSFVNDNTNDNSNVKKQKWIVKNISKELGIIKWSDISLLFVFVAHDNTLIRPDELRNIADFCETLARDYNAPGYGG